MARQARLLSAALVGASLTQEGAAACDWCLPNFPWLADQPNGEIATTAVSCGGHFAQSCGECSLERGEDWCHGQCMWLWNECILPGFWDHCVRLALDCFEGWWRTLPYTLFIGLVMLAYACAYKKKIVDQLPVNKICDRGLDYEDWEERELGLFACFGQPSQCAWATLCTPVVAAKNYHVSGVMNFWPACFFVYIGMFSLFWPLFCVMVLVRTSFSQKLKRNLKFESNLVADFFVTLCCFPCEVGRESIEVNDQIGKTIECPFEVY